MEENSQFGMPLIRFWSEYSRSRSNLLFNSEDLLDNEKMTIFYRNASRLDHFWGINITGMRIMNQIIKIFHLVEQKLISK